MATKLRCLLLDDEIPGLTYLRMMCGQIEGVEVVKAFNDPEKFLEALPVLSFDVCILDIEMPKLSGLQVASQIKEKPVIFTTAYKEYAADAFDVNAIDYIRKPIQKERLEKALLKAVKLVNNITSTNRYVKLNTDRGKAVLFVEEILYVTGSDLDKRDKILWTEGGEHITLKNISFEQLISLLPSKEFCRINKKDVIAMKSVRFYSHDEITTRIYDKNHESLKLPLNDTYRSDFRSKMG